MKIFETLEHKILFLDGKEDRIEFAYLRSINKLTRVFLHAEFISAMKTVQNPTVFMKTQK